MGIYNDGAERLEAELRQRVKDLPLGCPEYRLARQICTTIGLPAEWEDARYKWPNWKTVILRLWLEKALVALLPQPAVD